MLLAGMFTLTFTACGGGDDTPEPTPTPTPTPVDTTAQEKPDTTATPTPVVVAEGWPEAYDGVMLQGFYWDSYSDSRWAQLTAQADELSQYFQLIWVPNSGKTSDFAHTGRQTMGYDPCYWLDHNTCWGTEDELRKMITAFKANGTGIIEDVVINHKNGLTTWVDFPDETYGTYTITWDNQNYSAICRNDECNSHGYKTTGANDTGDNFDGYRDLDHTNAQVQENVKTYLSFLLKELGYVGFRYDMVKGFAARYIAEYNATALPRFSVGECWDGNKAVVTNWINGTKREGKIQSAAFDFPLKYKINAAFGASSWNQLNNISVLANDPSYQRYAVTFVDNHDTYRENTRLRSNVCAANAYILMMPGTPCLFLKHWQAYKGTLKRLIALRKAVGINSQSEIKSAQATDGGFILNVEGKKGSVSLILGNPTDITMTGDQQLVIAGKDFQIYTGLDVDISAVKAITDEDADPEDDSPVAVPDFCTVATGETCAFFEAPTSWGNIKCWRWDNQYNYTGNSWPGVDCTLLGTSAKGRKVWKWTYNEGDRRSQTSPNAGIIFNDGSNQTADLEFKNGGYYTEDGLQAVVAAQ